MTTSLAEQLQNLAIPQATALKRDKKRASLLFDPKEAASLRRETVYQIGLEGLDELTQKNEVFQQFYNTLFHVTSKDFERSIQNTEANEKLDKHIQKFLCLLSPYFMLNCSHKALEWMINRYSIHEYNREDLLMLCLPYHESNVFVRLIQLMKFKDAKDSFFFLKSLQRTGAHLPKQSLLNHAASNSGFLKFVTKYLLQLLKHHEKPNLLTVAFNFYCTVFTGALEFSEEISEDQVSQMLPSLLKGLNSPIADFCAASFVITARLVTKTSLSAMLLDKFVEKISEVKIPGLKTEASLILLLLYQSQKHYNQLPQIAVANLSEKEWLPKELQNLNNSRCLIYPFLEIIVSTFTEEGINNDLKLARDMLRECLNQIKLEDSFVPTFLNCILEATRSKKDISEEARSWLVGIVQSLENQYPTAFDKEVYKILSSTSDKKTTRRRKCLMKILKNTMTYQGKFNIFEKLYHPNPMFRSEAVKCLLENYESLKETDREIINSSFVDRLKDDSVDVVKETLSLLQKTSKIDKESFKSVLIQLAYKYQRDPATWESIGFKVAGMLSSNFDSNDWLVFAAIFPFLLSNSPNNLKKCKKLLESPFFSNHELFKSHISRLRSAHDVDSFTKLVLKVLSANSELVRVQDFLQVVGKHDFKDENSTFHFYITLLISSCLLPNCSPSSIGEEIVKISEVCINSSQHKCKNETSVAGYVRIAASGEVPIIGVLQCIRYAIDKIQINNSNIHDFRGTKNGFVLRLIVLLSSNDENYEKVLNILLGRLSKDVQGQAEFLLNLCISENELLGQSFNKNALAYVKKMLEADEDSKQFIYTDKSATAFLLILLSNPNEDIRQIIFDLFDYLLKVSTRKSTSYFHLLDNLNKHRKEIIMDCEQVPLIMFNILDQTSTRGKKNAVDLNAIRNQLLKLSCDETSPIYLKAGILKLLSHINSVNILEKVSKVASEILDKNTESIKSFDAKFIVHVVSKIEAKVLPQLTLETTAWSFIESCLKNDKTVIFNDEEDKITPSPLMMNQLEKDCFDVLDAKVIEKLLDVIIEIASTAQNPEVLPAASRIFKHIDLDANLILNQLVKMRDVQSPKVDEAKKKRRISVIPTVDILDMLEWRKGITVLEFIQDKKKIRNTDGLLQVLFEILKRCLDFDEQAAVEYPKQLLLSSILHCCSKAEQALPENVFNLEVIVQCIRASQNPQTHHHALLVLAHTAHLIPTQVLHHMMAIFTFMGSSVLRHDDAYSFQIISKIIDTIIPILVKDNNEADIVKVLRVFVDALLDVPEHRRMPLYKQLLERIDPKENLYLFLLIVVEAQVMHSSEEKQKKDTSQRRLIIAANLSREFSPDTVLLTVIKMVKYLQALPEEKEDAMQVDVESSAFDVAAHTPKDFRHYKYLLIKFVSSLLGSPEFVNQVAALSEEAELELEPLLKEIIVTVLQYIQKTSKVVEKAVNTPQAHYWKVILHLSYDILDSINALVTSPMFLLVTKGLMVHNLPTVRRRILELLNTKLQYNSQFLLDCEINDIYTLIPPIISIIEGIDDGLESDQEIIIQTALLSLKLLIKSLAQSNPEKFIPIMEFITNLIVSGKAKNNVLASVVLCLAELCVNLKGHAIASLPDFMPAIIKILKHQKHEESSNVLLKSIITTVEKIIDSVPLFLSPYLEKLLIEISILLSKWDVTAAEQKTQPFINKLSNIKQKIGATIPLRVLLPPVEQCYNRLVDKKCYKATGSLMDILLENVANLKGPDINSNLPDLTSFFLNALKFRADSECSLEDANLVESHIVKAFTALILKLSENTFRPLYYKLYDWAVRSEVKSERLITFYNLSSGIAQSLKGLFVLFAGHFINNSAQTMDSCNKVKNEELYFEEDSKNILLLENVLRTLNPIFLYDSQKFINRERFDILMQPLVDQLENTLGGIDELVRRNSEVLTPCLVHFALATADDALWKQMNYQILLKMRHNTPKIRLVALHCLTEIVKKLGEDFLPLLPETIPFLSELLEDEEEDVEKACQKAVQEMEKVLGESLQKYF